MFSSKIDLTDLLLQTNVGRPATFEIARADCISYFIPVTDLFNQPLPSSVLLDDGQLSATFSISIQDDAFLHYGAVFRVDLLGSELLQGKQYESTDMIKGTIF